MAGPPAFFAVPALRPRRAALVLPLAALGLAACSSSRPVAPPAPPPAPAAPRVDIAATETMDLAPYVAERPVVPQPVQHEVPADLMTNRVPEAPAPVAEARRPAPSRPAPVPTRPTPTPTRTPTRPTRPVYAAVQGYRVQIIQSTNRAEAERAVQSAMSWWRRSRGGSPEVYLVYRAPYYRVRVGNFAQRPEADRVARAFPNAFVVPDRVTVRQVVQE